MSSENDVLKPAREAEKYLNSDEAKSGHNNSTSSTLSGSLSFSVTLWQPCHTLVIPFLLIFGPTTNYHAADESGVDESVTSKFPGSTVTTGSAASGTGNNREIPDSEGGDVDAKGRPSKAGHFVAGGVGTGPESNAKEADDIAWVSGYWKQAVYLGSR